MKPSPEPPPCWGGLLIFMWPITIIFSILVQCFITAWRVDHKRRPRARRHGHRSVSRSNSRPRETREEARQRKYRYLYQVRTARGDIISQVSQNQKLQLYCNDIIIIEFFFYFFFIYRTMYQHYKNVLSPVTVHHLSIQQKQIHKNGIHWTVIVHILQTFRPIQISIKWI